MQRFLSFLSAHRLSASLPLMLLFPGSLSAQYYTWSHFAGTTGSPGTGDSPGNTARFYKPQGLTFDTAGNLFVVDRSNDLIRRITPDGIVSTYAGVPGSNGHANGPRTSATFSNPQGITIDAAGNLYVAESLTIRKITPDGIVSTLAGGSFGSADGTGAAAAFAEPVGITLDPATGALFITDASNHNIRKVTLAGVVTTVAGLAGASGSANGTGTAARFYRPHGIAAGDNGQLFIADANNHAIRKLDPATGTVITFAGLTGTSGADDSTGTSARFYYPTGIAAAPGGVLYVVDNYNNNIRRISPAGAVTTVAGQYDAEGTRDGLGRNARFNNPFGITIGPGGSLYVSDWENSTIRIVTPEGWVGTFAGVPLGSGSSDSSANTAMFDSPRGLSMGSDGQLLVADFGSHTIRRVNPAGSVSTVAGLAGQGGAVDAQGNTARFYLPAATAVDASGTIFVADFLNQTIRKVIPGSVVSTFAGLAGTVGSADGTGNAARFLLPVSIAVDSTGMAFVADQNNNTIRKITPAGTVSTLAGLAGTSGHSDGTGSSARFNAPSGVALDAAGNVYVSESNNHTIRKITPGGTVSTLAGQPGEAGSADGVGAAARFNHPSNLTVDSLGTVFVTDFSNHAIRKITPTGGVTTIGGLPGTSGSAAGTGRAARFFEPNGIAVDSLGILYVGDTSNRRIVKGTPHTTPWLAWLAFHQITSGASGDEDRDGRSNLLEFAFGTHPKIADGISAAAPAGEPVRRGSPAILPGPSAGTWQLVFARRLDRAASSLTYTVEQSTALSVWSAVPGTPAFLANDGDVEIVAMPLPAASAPRFFRLKAVVPP